MKTLKQTYNKYTEVNVMDEPADGGACHDYQISRIDDASASAVILGEFGFVQFQKGPMRENELNGCFMEDLLAIVEDRLKDFQNGNFACRENALALTKIQEAMHWMNHRTADRNERDVEGTCEE